MVAQLEDAYNQYKNCCNTYTEATTSLPSNIPFHELIDLLNSADKIIQGQQFTGKRLLEMLGMMPFKLEPWMLLVIII